MREVRSAVRVGVTDYYQDTGRARLIFRFVKKGHIQSLAEGFQNIFCYDRLKSERIQLPESFINLAEKYKDPGR